MPTIPWWTRCLRWRGPRSSSQSRTRPNDARSGCF
jgi:hypothetical protein